MSKPSRSPRDSARSHPRWAAVGRFLVAALALAITSGGFAQQGALVPWNQSSHTDKAGNEWNLEQNGMINRPNSGNSVIGGCASLLIGNQQFYCNQPMATPDGREIVMTGGQPLGGMSVTRRARFLDKEGGVRFIEQVTNSLGRDTTITVEIRHNFNNNGRTFITDRARILNGALDVGESGVTILPGQGSAGASSLLLTFASPRSTDKPRITTRNQYQLSTFHTFTVPAGKTAAIIHTIGMAKTSLSPDEAELQKAFRPLALARMSRDIPRDIAGTIMNLKSSQSPEILKSWFPPNRWGIKPDNFDVLAIGDGTRLKGKSHCAKLRLKHALGAIDVPWENVAALAGARFTGAGRGAVWLRDGGLLFGEIETDALQFTLVSGLDMNLNASELDRLVLSGSLNDGKWPDGVAAFVETTNGDRLALTETAATLPMLSLWGEWLLELKEVADFTAPEEGALSGLARLRDGTRIRLLPSAGTVSLATKRFGAQAMPLTDIRQIVTAEAAKLAENDDAQPAQSFVELAGGQRLVGRVTGERIRMATSGGLVELSPASIRDMHDVTEEQDTRDNADGRIFQADLWGGGTVMGTCADAVMPVAGKGFDWSVPVHHITRVCNPVPKIESAVMAKIGALIRDLGSETWKAREAATAQLKELGALARPSLQEAAKQSTDAEVIRRIEELLQASE